jgi:hypothetical protein
MDDDLPNFVPVLAKESSGSSVPQHPSLSGRGAEDDQGAHLRFYADGSLLGGTAEARVVGRCTSDDEGDGGEGDGFREAPAGWGALLVPPPLLPSPLRRRNSSSSGRLQRAASWADSRAATQAAMPGRGSTVASGGGAGLVVRAVLRWQRQSDVLCMQSFLRWRAVAAAARAAAVASLSGPSSRRHAVLAAAAAAADAASAAAGAFAAGVALDRESGGWLSQRSDSSDGHRALLLRRTVGRWQGATAEALRKALEQWQKQAPPSRESLVAVTAPPLVAFESPAPTPSFPAAPNPAPSEAWDGYGDFLEDLLPVGSAAGSGLLALSEPLDSLAGTDPAAGLGLVPVAPPVGASPIAPPSGLVFQGSAIVPPEALQDETSFDPQEVPANLALGERLFAVNPVFRDGTRLRWRPCGGNDDDAFNGVQVLNDWPVVLLEVSGTFGRVRVEAEDQGPDSPRRSRRPSPAAADDAAACAGEGWIRLRNLSRTRRFTGFKGLAAPSAPAAPTGLGRVLRAVDASRAAHAYQISPFEIVAGSSSSAGSGPKTAAGPGGVAAVGVLLGQGHYGTAFRAERLGATQREAPRSNLPL